jgi:hypothetical protein
MIDDRVSFELPCDLRCPLVLGLGGKAQAQGTSQFTLDPLNLNCLTTCDAPWSWVLAARHKHKHKALQTSPAVATQAGTPVGFDYPTSPSFKRPFNNSTSHFTCSTSIPGRGMGYGLMGSKILTTGAIYRYLVLYIYIEAAGRWGSPMGTPKQMTDPDVVGWFLGGQKNTRAGHFFRFFLSCF